MKTKSTIYIGVAHIHSDSDHSFAPGGEGEPGVHKTILLVLDLELHTLTFGGCFFGRVDTHVLIDRDHSSNTCLFGSDCVNSRNDICFTAL